MKKGKFPKKLFKKKTNRIIAITAVVVLGAGIAFAVSVRARNAQKQASGTNVQSTFVTKGSISNTIDASGNLETAETVDITVPTGIKVDSVNVESGETVTKGQTLAKLNKTSVTRLLVEVKDNLESIEDELDQSGLSSLEKEELNGEKSELEKTEKALTALYENPVITASTDGIIGTIYISENAETSNNAASTSSDSSDSTGQSSSSLSQLSAESTKNTKEKTSDLLFLTADLQSDTSEQSADDSNDPADSSDAEEQLKTVTDYSALTIQTPIAGEAPQKSIKETSSYTGTISWDCSNSIFQSGTVYTATIVLTAKSGYTFSEKNLPIIKDASFNWNIYHSGEGNTLKIVAKYEKTADVQTGQDSSSDQTSSGSNAGNSNTASGSEKPADSSDNTNNTSDNKAGNTNSSPSGGMTGARSGSVAGGSGNISGGSSSGTASASTASSSSPGYSNYETVAFSIAKQDSAKIVVNVDELDILSVQEKQSAAVTLDALENEEYTGTVTKISNTASAGSGSTKYEVEITVPMDEKNMRIGMSASAAIQVSSSEDTLLLPMTALQQKGEETFVYTEKDSKGNLSGAITVETGLSDGQNVEILSGIEEGTEVYYTRAGTDDSDSSDAGRMFPGGMGNMGGNGEMPTPPDGGKNHQNSDGSHRNGEKGDGFSGGGRPSGN